VSFSTSYAETTNYVYDELNRLIRVEYGDGTKIVYTYDEVGNRSQVYVGNYTLAVNVVGSGTVTKNPDQPIYSAGTSVTLTAVNGSQAFTEWSGDLTGNINPTTIVMDGNKSVTATFSWLQGWTYRKAVTLSRASGAVTNYQMRLLVGETSGASGEDVDCNGHVQADFDDLRFITSDGGTLLDYWIESITGATPNQLATVWIKFDSIGTTPTAFYIYYGKADATAYSNAQNTFIFFDNFSGDLSAWTQQLNGGSISIVSNQLVIDSPANKQIWATTDTAPKVYKDLTSSVPFAAYVKVVSFGPTANYDQAGIGIRKNATNWVFVTRQYWSTGGGQVIDSSRNNAGASYLIDTDALSTSPFWMRIAHESDISYFWYSTDNSSWTSLGSYSMALSTRQLFLYSSSSSSHNPPAVTFDTVYVTNYSATAPAWGSWGAEEAY
jgi:YD repeat-containing protein